MADWVEIEWPDGAKANPSAYLAQAGLECRRVESGGYRITTRSQYLRKREVLLSVACEGRVDHLDIESVIEAIERWPASPADAGMMEQTVREEVDRLLGREQPEWNNYLEAAQLLATCLPRDDFARWFRESFFPTLATTLPDATLSILNFAPEIHARTATVRALFTAANAPDWIDPSVNRGFESLRGFAGGALQGQTTWLDPLFVAAFPWMFGAGVPRGGVGILGVGFGFAAPYRSNLLDGELDSLVRADLLQSDVSLKATATPSISADTTVAAIRWWTDQTSDLFSVILDPTIHADENGKYIARDHFALTVSFERVIASTVKCLLLTGRDEYSRRIHLFEVLDLLEGLNLGGYDHLLRASAADEDLMFLESTLPPEVAALVLPRCRAAVAGLKDVATGFVPSRVADDMLQLSSGPVPLEKAAAMVLRQVRNAGHGLRKALRDPKKREYIALHDGGIPTAVSDVAFLHFVRLLAEPGRLRQRLTRRPSR